MVGLINTFQIIVVQLHWEGPEETKVLNETWKMQLNGRKEKQIPLCVRGEVSIPKIVVGENNTVKFESNQPGCQSMKNVPLKNVSCFQIKYGNTTESQQEFEKLKKEIFGIN